MRKCDQCQNEDPTVKKRICQGTLKTHEIEAEEEVCDACEERHVKEGG